MLELSRPITITINISQKEELEVPYDIKKYERTASRRAPPELRAVHPLGKSPVITDGGVTIAESGAIVGTSRVLSVLRIL